MKRNIIIPAFAFLFLQFLSSCAWEKEVGFGGQIDPRTRGLMEVEVTGNLGVGTDAMKTVRFFVFSDLGDTRRAEVNKFIPEAEFVGTSTEGVSTFTSVLQVTRKADNPNEKKLVVAVVNEPSEMTAGLNRVTSSAELEDLELIMADFLNGQHISLTENMPMTGALWTNETYDTEALARENLQTITLQRAVAKVELYMKTSITGDVKLLTGSSVVLKNTYDKSNFVYHKIGGDVLGDIQTVPVAGFTGKDKTWTPDTDKPITASNALVCSFYTPERSCVTAAEKLVLDITAKISDGVTRSGTITLTEAVKEGESTATQITAVERNSIYRIFATIGARQMSAEVIRWSQVPIDYPIPSQYRLDVDRDVLTFPYEGDGGTPQTVKVTWNHPLKWDVNNTVTDWDAPELGMDVTTTRTALGSADAPQSGIVTVWAKRRTDNKPDTHEGFFYVESGNLKGKKIIVRQLGATLAFNVEPNELHFPYSSDTKTATVTSNYTDEWAVAKSGTDTSAFTYPPDTGVAGNGTFDVTTVKRALNDDKRKFTATLTVAVTPSAPGASETVTVDQMYAWLKWNNQTNAPTTIPTDGGTYYVGALTNMPGWGVRMYVTDATPGNKVPTTGFGGDLAGTTRPTSNLDDAGDYMRSGIEVPANPNTTKRYISFYLYCTEYPNDEVYAFTREQDEAVPPVSDGDFAGSNVYWDDEKKILTFDGAEDRSKEHYQGVYFMWGSLIGISPSPFSLTAAPRVFVPLYNSGSPTFDYTHDMNDAICSTDGDNFGTAVYPTYMNWAYFYGDQSWNAGTPTTYWNDKKGDICVYLGETGAAPKGYRMPTASEISNNNNSTANQPWNESLNGYSIWPEGTYNQWTPIAPVNEYGTTHIPTGAKTSFGGGAFLPASGFRNSSGHVSPTTDVPGVHGLYMTSTTLGVQGGSSSKVRHMDFINGQGTVNYINFGGGQQRRYAVPVRCIRDTSLDTK